MLFADFRRLKEIFLRFPLTHDIYRQFGILNLHQTTEEEKKTNKHTTKAAPLIVPLAHRHMCTYGEMCVRLVVDLKNENEFLISALLRAFFFLSCAPLSTKL